MAAALSKAIEILPANSKIAGPISPFIIRSFKLSITRFAKKKESTWIIKITHPQIKISQRLTLPLRHAARGIARPSIPAASEILYDVDR